MVRTPLTSEQRDRGRALGQILRAARGPRPASSVAAEAGISIETLRKIERGAIAVPAFFTVAALARVLDLDLAELARTLDGFEDRRDGASMAG
ncbi:helix-turn-helix transcriptional regulator [Actinomadura kijaniata]|uniref:Transcriptional regulator with XRE-family HTH domain n=1 Tax=Actinomadura namibiensis TaxID=182080 RepID=A0A7W3LTI1_ACTNM|nr:MULTISPECIES: helix-turn-helix transcriptional regulator [Actinomadura]MBA8953962.1 transcriptional regulator with XRE-family HTH domain [Actinomadura namibiensis]